jgi:organic radical activating enzyme
LAGPEWKLQNSVLNYAGRFETDMWEQLVPHLDSVEQIYFAGGEPLLMEEHYNILKELIRRGRRDVRLIYNTNFTHTDLKGESVFELWNQFDSVAVGASLDDQGARGEYIRKGTDWAVVEQNRRDMIKICPQVDFYISPTLSIMNALSLPKFHRDWVEKGLLKPQDLNVNILQFPNHYRIDIATAEYKEKIKETYTEHLEWLRPHDRLQRATVGFESAIQYMNATDNTQLIDQFWRKTHELDTLRNENILDIIPELRALK